MFKNCPVSQLSYSEKMKIRIFPIFLVLVAFLNFTGGVQNGLSPVRTFQYRPAVHTNLVHFIRSINGVAIGFNAFTTLVARDATLIGWLDHQHFIQPIFWRNRLITYNLDEQVLLEVNRTQLEACGVYQPFPVGPFGLSPVRTFQYRHAIHMYLAHLMRKVNEQPTILYEHTTLVARGADLYGWLNPQGIVEPLYMNNDLVIFNLDEHIGSNTDMEKLITYRIFEHIPAESISHSRSNSRSTSSSITSRLIRTPPRSRSRSPQNEY